MNKLEHLSEFQSVLTDYHVSDESKAVLAQTELVLFAAPTSSGRNTLIRELLKTGNYHYLVSDTTRHPRVNDDVLEQNGVEYWFRPEQEILDDLRAGNFLEAAIIHNQQVSGMSIRELKKAHQAGKVAVTDIEIAGVETIIKLKPDTICLFIVPPNFEEWMRRIQHRGQMSPEEFHRRLTSAEKEFKHALEHDYYRFVVNDTVKESVKLIDKLARLHQIDQEQQEKARQVVEKLLQLTHKFLVK